MGAARLELEIRPRSQIHHGCVDHNHLCRERPLDTEGLAFHDDERMSAIDVVKSTSEAELERHVEGCGDANSTVIMNGYSTGPHEFNYPGEAALIPWSATSSTHRGDLPIATIDATSATNCLS